MSYYVIGIGGTGAKGLESLIHLAAAGMMPNDTKLQILCVDPDNGNGSRGRVQTTLDSYIRCREGLSNLLNTEINSIINSITDDTHPLNWSPFEGDANPRLNNFFDYNNLRHENRAAADLFEVLYSPRERANTLDQGFNAHPSIGAAVIAQTVDFSKDPWRNFVTQIKEDSSAKVFIIGSIFGGTGAAGFPTIAELIKNNSDLEKVDLGGALVLPYFSFADEENDGSTTSNEREEKYSLKAESKYFLMNTQAALKYYYFLKETQIYDAVYLFGNESQVNVKNSSGGSEQKNAPHFIELYAALAAIDFFESGNTEQTQYFLPGRRDSNILEWTDLPDRDSGNKIRDRIGALTRFAFAYLNYYQPIFQEIHNGGELRAKDYTWFVNFFQKGFIRRNIINLDDSSVKTKVGDVEEYCKTFLRWIANIHANCANDESINLIKYDAFADDLTLETKENTENLKSEIKDVNQFKKSEFGNLIQGERCGDYDRLAGLMNNTRNNGQTGDIELLGQFLKILYENCQS